MWRQSHRDYLRSGYLHHRLPVMHSTITGDNGHYLQSPARQKCQENQLANAAITDMQMRQRDVAALDAKYTKERQLMLKLKMMLCVMMLPLVVVGCTSAVCQSVREAFAASGVDNAASPDWQTPLNGIISPSERG